MEEVAFIAATRSSRTHVVMLSSDKLNFHKTIPENIIVEITGKVVHVTNTSVTLRIDIYSEHLTIEERELVASGTFIYATREDAFLSPSSGTESPQGEKSFVGGEKELRKILNARLAPITIGRASLYNHLEMLNIRKAFYTLSDVEIVMKHLQNLKSVRKTGPKRKMIND